MSDATHDAADRITFVVGDTSYVVRRDGGGDVPAQVAESSGGWVARAELPLSGGAIGELVAFDVQVTDAGHHRRLEPAGRDGDAHPRRGVSRTRRRSSAPVPPAIDGEIDGVWSLANTVSTDVAVQGAGGATALVRTLWRANTLYVLAEVTDGTPDVSGSDPWVQDSLEIFLDAGNAKNGPYRFDDTQIRISAENVTSFGTGDVAFQEARLESETASTDDGYVVEAAVSLLEYGGAGTFHGLDFQVNDGSNGVRTSIRTWADPTGLGYQSTARWGVAKLVETDARAADRRCDRVAARRRAPGRTPAPRRSTSSSGRSPRPTGPTGPTCARPRVRPCSTISPRRSPSSASVSARARTRTPWRRRRGISSRCRDCSH